MAEPAAQVAALAAGLRTFLYPDVSKSIITQLKFLAGMNCLALAVYLSALTYEVVTKRGKKGSLWMFRFAVDGGGRYLMYVQSISLSPL